MCLGYVLTIYNKGLLYPFDHPLDLLLGPSNICKGVFEPAKKYKITVDTLYMDSQWARYVFVVDSLDTLDPQWAGCGGAMRRLATTGSNIQLYFVRPLQRKCKKTGGVRNELALFTCVRFMGCW